MYNIVYAKDLVKHYRLGQTIVPALRGITFMIQRGEIVSIVGPSGSGKSTLLNLIGCLDLPTSGVVEIDGEPVTQLTPYQLTELRARKIGLVFQTFNLIPVLTAFENIELALWGSNIRKSEKREQIMQILTAVGLRDRAWHRPSELSGGEQQRVAIARALITHPAIVLADEPTANLDSKTGEAIMQLMVEMNRTLGVTFLFATHDLRIMKHADRVIELADGLIHTDRSSRSEA